MKYNYRQFNNNITGGIIKMNLNECIVVPRKIVIEIGFNATGMLVELFNKYNFNKKNSTLNQYGEFSYKIADCKSDNGLTKSEQASTIKKLIEAGYIEYTISRGLPKLRYFKLTDKGIEIYSLK